MKLKTLMVIIPILSILAGCSQLPKTEGFRAPWFDRARFGIAVSYLLGSNYNQAADSFNVEKFADQIARTKCDYVIFPLGQNSGYYCSPNATYERYAGYQPGQRCTRRDLPMEIADALAKRHIHLILYLPSRSPQNDPQAMQGLGDIDEWKVAPQIFVKRWSDVIKEWSLRYGEKISGWWFDGAYKEASWQDMNKPYNFKTWAEACRAGNPKSILAFNNGAKVKDAFKILTPEQDYIAGEQARFGMAPNLYPPYPKTKWHILSYLGEHWGDPSGPTYTDDWLIRYVKRVNRQGGVVSIDVHIDPDGTIYPPHLDQLITLGKSVSAW